MITSAKIQPVWNKFEINEYSPTTPIVKIMEFTKCLVQKEDPWTKTKQSIKLLLQTFVRLTKTSPEVFLGDWKKSGDLHPSLVGSKWTASIKVLGCAFRLQVQIKVPVKTILKNNTEDLKLRGKSLTFDPTCVPTKTKTGRFLTGKELLQSFVKRQCVSKQLTWKFQSYIEVTFCSNMYGLENMIILFLVSEICY